MRTVNIGILAHVDAGKTSLTERLLYDAGVIGALGSVNAGTTQTDSGELERRRGITIRTAVASFTAGDQQINLVDTPGHIDFVAEVERALTVLDGAVLVVSAVEGVQPHTRSIMRILKDLRIPTLLFLNKVDRSGARTDELVPEIRRRLGVNAAAMSRVSHLGTRDAVATADRTGVAEALAEQDDALLAELVEGRTPAPDRVEYLLARLTAAAAFHPVYCGSALSGTGVPALVDGITRYLDPPAPEPRLRARVFAIDRTVRGERRAYLRVYGGELAARQRVTLHRPGEPAGRGQLTGVEVVGSGAATARAGDIVRVRGLAARIGDQVGSADGLGDRAHFARPSVETVVRPVRPADKVALHRALSQLAEADPLIGLRVAGTQISVLLYGEVQKEVVAATLAGEFGIDAVFERSQLVHVERPLGPGRALEPPCEYFCALVGLGVEPAAPGTGITFRRAVELGGLPLSFHKAIEDTVHSALEQGLSGWPVTDIAVTLTDTWFDSVISTAGDFRTVTPLVLLQALAMAGTRVYEPCHAFTVDVPTDRVGPVLGRLAQLGAAIGRSAALDRETWRVEGSLPARLVHGFTQRLPGLSAGEGAWVSRPEGDRLVSGRPPMRRRTDGNPVDRDAYLTYLSHGAPPL